MKSVIRAGIAAIALVAAGGAQLAHADSFALSVQDRNVGVGINIGAPVYVSRYEPRYVQVVPAAPPACERRTGYWATDGYRRVWVESPWAYPPQRWEQPVRYWNHGYRGWHGDRDDYREHWEHGRHEHEWHDRDDHYHHWR